METNIETVFSEFTGNVNELIQILRRVQEEFGYLSDESIKSISNFTRVPKSKVYGVATFYSQFRFTPIGKYMIKVCHGTACHVKGAKKILDEISRNTCIKEGETSADMQYTLEGVACIGCCALAPCITINNEVYGRLNPKSTEQIFKSIKSGEKNQ